MAAVRISEKARNFIYQHIDSVELLEILLLLYADADKSWSPESLALELRSNSNSTLNRLTVLKRLGLVAEVGSSNQFCYQTTDVNQDKLVEELSAVYRVHRHRVLEMIFSPSKKARDFADAFVVPSKKNEGEDRG